MDNAFEFHGECTVFLKKGDHRRDLLAKSNFIRPEDVYRYEELCDGMKLATRTNFNPLAVASAYLDGRWQGSLPDLTEPAHSELFRPQIISGAKFPADYGKVRFDCDKRCESCSYCREVQKNATVTPAREAAFLE